MPSGNAVAMPVPQSRQLCALRRPGSSWLCILCPALPRGPQATCSTDYDCYYVKKLGSNGAQPGGTVKCINGQCLCTIWTPRERFAAAAHGSRIYVVGGVTEVRLQVRWAWCVYVCVCECVCECVCVCG